MEILLWLVPPVAVTVVAMAWVGWLGREGRGQVDRDEAARRIGVALERDGRQRPEVGGGAPGARSSGVVVRRAPPSATPERDEVAPVEVLPVASTPADADPRPSVRRAS